VINFINGIAEFWFRYMASATVQATLLALFVLCLVHLGRRWAPALRYALMMLALCKFLIPPMLSLPTGVFSLIKPRQLAKSPATIHYAASSTQDIDFNTYVQRRIREARVNSSLPAPVLTNHGKLLLFHFSGALLIAALAIIQKARLRRLVSRSSIVQDPALKEAYEKLCLSMQLLRKPKFLISEANHAPMAFGLRHPVVMLPEAIVAALPLSEIMVILGHELAHHRHRDLWISWMQVIVSAIWWFNPVYWLLAKSIRGVREDCCDDMILSYGIVSRENYCQTLLKAARTASARMTLMNADLAYLGESQPLRRRFKRIMNAKFIRFPKLAITTMLAIIALALVLLPGVRPQTTIGNNNSSNIHAVNTGDLRKDNREFGNSYYGKACANPIMIQDAYNKIIVEILNKGWKDDDNIIKFIKDNSASIELFKKATLEANGGSVLSAAFKSSSSDLRFIRRLDLIRLAKLLLLEGKYNEAKGLHKEAKEDYLAAARFAVHLSEQRSDLLLQAINSSYIDWVDSSSTKYLLDDASYRKSLLENLRKIKGNQDVLSDAIHENARKTKDGARTFEQDAKKGASFETLFQVAADGFLEKEQAQIYNSKSKELTAILDGEFFAEFCSQVDSLTDELTSAALRAAKENDGKMYKAKSVAIRKSCIKEGESALSDASLLSLDNAAEGGKAKLTIADIMAKYLVTITMPDYSGPISRYWTFNTKLDSLINKMAN
jgi:beta-lactamase regulating signal transducer with metallopeptidase domain